MADTGEKSGVRDEVAKDDEERPVSRGSGESKKSIQDAVSKLTVRALKEFRLSDPSDGDTVITGMESDGLVPTANLTQEIPAFYPQGASGVQTLLSNQGGISGTGDYSGEGGADEGIGADDGGDDNLSDEESASDGESDLVVLDPDHVSRQFTSVILM